VRSGAVAELASLRKLVLDDCEQLTDAGVAHLGARRA
jgi:hypothetical protein